MNFIFKHLMMFALLTDAGWTIAQAQSLPTQRIDLTLEDNRSVYTTVGELNQYENDLRLNQPSGNYKLTASLLNEGDNFLTFFRQGDNESDPTEVARINLSAVKTVPSIFYDGFDFYGDGNSAPSSNTYVTNAMLAQISPNWRTSDNGQGLTWQTNGCAYVHATDGLTFTVPEGYSNVVVQFDIMVGPDAAYGKFAYQVNSDGWYIASSTAQTGSVATDIFTDLNSGDVISILGANSSQGQLTYSPDIAWIEVQIFPSSYIPSIEITPTLSYKNNGSWGTANAIGTSATYAPNDVIDLYNLGTVTDRFDESTATNSHPNSYSYSVKFDANVMLPQSGASTSFYANANFASQTITGEGTWVMNGGDIYRIDTQNNLAAILDYWGALLFTLPETFAGSQVTVAVTSCPGEYGARDLYVNGVPHTFTSNSTYTWTVDVAANGIIEFRGPSNTYSAGISNIVITSSNNSSLNAPQHSGMKMENSLRRGLQHQADEPKLYQEKATERISINKVSINEK